MGTTTSQPNYKIDMLSIKIILDKCKPEMLQVENFLDEQPVETNFHVSKKDDTLVISEIYNTFVENSYTFRTLIAVRYLTANCQLKVSKPQHDRLSFFRDYYLQSQQGT